MPDNETQAITPNTPVTMPMQVILVLCCIIGSAFLTMVVGDVKANATAICDQAEVDRVRFMAIQKTMNATLVTLEGMLVADRYARLELTNHIKQSDIHTRK